MESDDLLRRYAKPLTFALAALAVAAFTISAANGAPDSLPGVALGSAVLLHFERALAFTVGAALLMMFLARAWRGEFPRELSTSGAKWPEARADAAIAAELREQAAEDRVTSEAFERAWESWKAEKPQVTYEDLPKLLGLLSTLNQQRERGARRQEFAAAMLKLPEREKLVLALKYYEGLSGDEIAKTLAVSRAAVHRLEQRALRRLEDEFGEGVVQLLRDDAAGTASD